MARDLSMKLIFRLRHDINLRHECMNRLQGSSLRIFRRDAVLQTSGDAILWSILDILGVEIIYNLLSHPDLSTEDDTHR